MHISCSFWDVAIEQEKKEMLALTQEPGMGGVRNRARRVDLAVTRLGSGADFKGVWGSCDLRSEGGVSDSWGDY
eukprot:gene15633-biopygen4342